MECQKRIFKTKYSLIHFPVFEIDKKELSPDDLAILEKFIFDLPFPKNMEFLNRISLFIKSVVAFFVISEIRLRSKVCSVMSDRSQFLLHYLFSLSYFCFQNYPITFENENEIETDNDNENENKTETKNNNDIDNPFEHFFIQYLNNSNNFSELLESTI
jgi:hypothetical protein